MLTSVFPDAVVLIEAAEAAVFVCVSEPGPAVPEAMFGEGFSILEVTVVIEPRPFIVDFTTASSSALSRINKSMGMGLNR